MLLQAVGGRASTLRAGAAPRAGAPQTPIQHVVIILKENRSFDEYFGKFPGADGASQGEMHNGQVVDLVPTLEPMPNDIGHSSNDFFLAYNNGDMNGFDLEEGAFSENGEPLAYSQMSEAQIPNYWAYARRYAIGDAMFSDFHGASFMNHLFAISAQSGAYDPGIAERGVYTFDVRSHSLPKVRAWGCDGAADSVAQMLAPDGAPSSMYPCFGFDALPNILQDYGVSWKFYGDSSSDSFRHNSLDAFRRIRYDPAMWTNVRPFREFEQDALAGRLPAVSWVLGESLEHPPNEACKGENESVSIMNAVMNGPNWSSTAIFEFWDEWGGFFDHVKPQLVDQFSYGFRVPLIVVSPWTKYGGGSDGGYISSVFYSPTSLLKMIETNWGLPSMNARDAAADDMLDFFDFTQVPKAPLVLQERQCPQMGELEEAARMAAADD